MYLMSKKNCLDYNLLSQDFIWVSGSSQETDVNWGRILKLSVMPDWGTWESEGTIPLWFCLRSAEGNEEKKAALHGAVQQESLQENHTALMVAEE